MSRPFTSLAGLLFLMFAAVHAYRLYMHFPVIVAGHDIPLNASWFCLALGVVFGLGLFAEARR